MGKKVLIIGLDGFTWTVGRKLIQDGQMPNLSKLVNNGCHGDLESVIPYETSPAWTSFQTGCYPAKTGIFAFHRYDFHTRQIQLNSFREIRVPTLWELVSTAGKKVISINMPMTSPPPSLDGIIIPGLTCPELSRETVYPPEIYDRYIKTNPDYMVVNNASYEAIDDYVKQAIHTEKIRCNLALQLMEEIDWDVFSVQIQSTDAFQHRNWWALDSEAVGFTEEDYGKAIKFYEEIDLIIKKLTQAAGASALTVVVSDHGFCSKKAEIGINTWLCQNGYLCFKPAKKKHRLGTAKDAIKESFRPLKYLARIYGEITKGITSGLSASKSQNLYSEKVVSHIRRMIEFDHSLAFCLGGMAGSLYLIGQMDRGRADVMIDKLLRAYGPDSSNPLITDIQSTENLFQNMEGAPFLPDYLISFSAGVEARISPEGLSVIKSGIQNGRQTGTHDQNGILLFQGPQVKTEYRLNASIVDIMPTILSYLSVPIPDHVDGKVLHQIFKEPLNVKYQTVEKKKKENTEYSDIDQSVVEKQLKDLGYL